MECQWYSGHSAEHIRQHQLVEFPGVGVTAAPILPEEMDTWGFKLAKPSRKQRAGPGFQRRAHADCPTFPLSRLPYLQTLPISEESELLLEETC